MKTSEPATRDLSAGQLPLSFDSTQCLLRTRALAPPSRPGLLACLDRFEVHEILGVGGMGIVLAARDTGSNRRVALKLLRPEYALHPRAVAQFLAEAQHMARLRHPHVLPVLEVVNRPEGPYYVMPFLRAGSLARLLKNRRPLAADTALTLARQVAAALHHAHNLGLIHRDLKPDNVLLDDDGRAHLADFGLVRSLFSNVQVDPHQGQYVGTAAYMSPAVAAGQAEDTRCDIYAFGALLYEMLTGRPPYHGENTRDVLRQIRSGPPRDIRSLNADADPRLAKVAASAMARELRDRYATMADAVDDLERVARGREPWGPHGIRHRHTKGSRRPLVAAFAATALVAAALGAWLARPGAPLREPRPPEPRHYPPDRQVVAHATTPPAVPSREVLPPPVEVTEKPVPAPTPQPPVKPGVEKPQRPGRLENDGKPNRLQNLPASGVFGMRMRQWSSGSTSQRGSVQVSNVNGVIQRNNQGTGSAQQKTFTLREEGNTVELTGSVTPAAKKVEWDWGDDTKQETKDITGKHVYAKPGAYTIRVKITDVKGGISTEEVKVSVD